MLKLLRVLLGVALVFSIAGCSFGLSGNNGINISGNASTNEITVTLDGSVVRGILTDAGNATGSGQWLSVLGSGNVTTSASGSTVVITSTGGSGPVDMSLGEGHIFVGNTSGLAEDMELSGDATLNGLGELDVTWADQSQSADTANSSTDSDKLDGLHGSSYLLGNATAVDSDKVDGSHASAFLAVAGTAADSDKLDGQHGAYYGVAGAGVTGLVAGSGISVSANTGNVTVTNTASSTLLLSKVKTYTRLTSTGSGDVGYTGVGFTPTSIQICTGSPAGYTGLSVGYADSACASYGQYYQAAGISTISGAWLVKCGVSGGYGQTAVVKSYDADGFTLTWTRDGSGSSTTSVLQVICYR